MPKGAVKIMLSYDYCHFEIALASDAEMTLEEIDLMRKDAQRLADKAVRQYKIAKKAEQEKLGHKHGVAFLEKKVKIIKENYPQSEWTEEQKATIKTHEDHLFLSDIVYDYDDDWEEEDNVC